MKNKIKHIGLLLLLGYGSLYAQQPATPSGEGKVDYPVFLDKADDLGKVMVFQSKDNPNDYYYLPTAVRVKKNENEVLQMGFQQYVKNEKSGHAEEETRTKGTGGGYFWMTVGFGLSAEERQDAERELQRRRPGARILGAMAYESGTAELLSFGIKDKTDSKTELLGVANAPLMEGDAVAVGMILDAENATKLWEALKLPVPGIGMNFHMNFRGYHSPVSAKITMDMEKIYKHRKMGAGIQAVFLSAEIEDIEKELKESGAIKVEQTGDIGGKWEDIMKEVLDNFRNECFSPINNMMNMMYAQDGASESPLDRAETLRQRRSGINPNTPSNSTLSSAISNAPNTTGSTISQTQPANLGSTENTIPVQPQAATPLTPDSQGGTQTGAIPTPDSQGGTQTGVILTPNSQGGTQMGAIPTPNSQGGTQASAANQPSGGITIAPSLSIGNSSTQNNTQTPQNNVGNGANALGISIYAGFQMKRTSERKIKTFELNKIRTANRDRNIALTLPRIPKANLQQINLDDPLYKQRELVTMIDGFSAQDFGRYINFVNVTMRKKHPKGDISTDEVVINRNNFNKEGNRFKLLYGWRPGDNDRNTWMNYEYKTTWSFFGGGEIAEDWIATQKGAINVAPPCRKEVIRLEGDAEALKQKDVRAINIKINYTVAGMKKSLLKSFNLSKSDPLAAEIEMIQPNNVFEYEYEIIWQLKGNRTITTGVKKGDTATLFIDELSQ